MNITAHLIIKGNVTGVFYRRSAKDFANKIGVTGWIKNTVEDNVEAIVSGNKLLVDEFIEWCKAGPPKARVTSLIISEREFTSFNTFEIKK
jgi:acylphosphatase